MASLKPSPIAGEFAYDSGPYRTLSGKHAMAGRAAASQVTGPIRAAGAGRELALPSLESLMNRSARANSARDRRMVRPRASRRPAEMLEELARGDGAGVRTRLSARDPPALQHRPDQMRAFPVSTRVNAPKNDDASVIAPVA